MVTDWSRIGHNRDPLDNTPWTAARVIVLLSGTIQHVITLGNMGAAGLLIRRSQVRILPGAPDNSRSDGTIFDLPDQRLDRSRALDPAEIPLMFGGHSSRRWGSRLGMPKHGVHLRRRAACRRRSGR